MKDLGTPGGNSSSATGISSRGQVTGTSTKPGDKYNHAFLGRSKPRMTDLGALAGHNSYASGINDSAVWLSANRH